MTRNTLALISLLITLPILSGCAAAVGAGAAVVADEAIEDREGGDGLF